MMVRGSRMAEGRSRVCFFFRRILVCSWGGPFRLRIAHNFQIRGAVREVAWPVSLRTSWQGGSPPDPFPRWWSLFRLRRTRNYAFRDAARDLVWPISPESFRRLYAPRCRALGGLGHLP